MISKHSKLKTTPRFPANEKRLGAISIKSRRPEE